LTFPSIQTYDDGEIVRWIQDTPEGGPEPDNPAPVLTLVSASNDGQATSDGGTDNAQAVADTSSSDDDGPDALTIVALVVGIVGVLLGGAALLVRRRAT
jgi:hypothetical protein